MIEFGDGVDLTELQSQITSQEQIDTANEREYRTIPTSGYRIQADKVQVMRDARQFAKVPGRLIAHIQASVTDKVAGRRVGTVFFDVSPEPQQMKKKDGTLVTKKDGSPMFDRETTLWGQAAKATGLTNVAEIIQAIEAYPLDAFIEESFKVGTEYVRVRSKDDAGNARTVNDMAEERKKLMEKVSSGEAKSFNNVLNLAKVK